MLAAAPGTAEHMALASAAAEDTQATHLPDDGTHTPETPPTTDEGLGLVLVRVASCWLALVGIGWYSLALVSIGIG